MRHLGIHLVEGLCCIYLHKIGGLLPLLEKCLPSAFECLDPPLPFAGKEHLSRCVKINHQIGPGIDVAHAPTVEASGEGLVGLVINGDGEIEQKVPII